MSPANSQQPFEWTIGTTDFRLAPREITGQQAHRIEPVPFLSQQISSTAELSYSDIDRRREVAFAQDDLSGGIASNLRFNLERSKQFRYSKGTDTSVPGIVLPGPKINTIGSTIADKPTGPILQRSTGILYVACGTKLYQVATSSSTPTLDSTFAASITALFEWGGYLLVGQGDSQVFCYRTGDVASAPTSGRTAFTDAAAGTYARYFTAVNDILYKAVRPKTLSLADAVTGLWADYDVGSSSFNITSLGVLDQVVIVGKEDGPYGFDQDFVAVPIIPELYLQSDAQVCKAALSFNRDYYVTSRRGMVRIRPSEGLKSMGLDTLGDPALPGNDSRPAAFTSDGRFLYAVVAPASTSGVYIWKRDMNDAWHNYLYRTDLGQAAEVVYATGKIGSTSVNAVVFSYQSGGNWQLAYARFPATLDPTKDSAYTYETAVASKVRSLDYVASYPTVKKYSDRLKHIVDSATSARATTYTAYVDDDTTTVTLGTYAKSPYEEKVLGTPLEYHRLSLELSTTTESATPPQIRAFHLSAAYLARTVNRHTCNFLAVSNMPLATGGRARGEWTSAINKLKDLQASKAAVACRDENGRKFSAYVDEITEWQAQEKQTQEGSPVAIATCIITEIGPSET